MGHNASFEYAVAKIHRRGPQDRCEHQPEFVGHAGLENHLYAASSTAGGNFAYSALGRKDPPLGGTPMPGATRAYMGLGSRFGCIA